MDKILLPNYYGLKNDCNEYSILLLIVFLFLVLPMNKHHVSIQICLQRKHILTLGTFKRFQFFVNRLNVPLQRYPFTQSLVANAALEVPLFLMNMRCVTIQMSSRMKLFSASVAFERSHIFVDGSDVLVESTRRSESRRADLTFKFFLFIVNCRQMSNHASSLSKFHETNFAFRKLLFFMNR